MKVAYLKLPTCLFDIAQKNIKHENNQTSPSAGLAEITVVKKLDIKIGNVHGMTKYFDKTVDQASGAGDGAGGGTSDGAGGISAIASTSASTNASARTSQKYTQNKKAKKT